MKLEFEMTVEELLDKLGQPNSWFREGDADGEREKMVLNMLQKNFPGKYVIEEYYNPNRMCFRYRLKFLNEADEMWFKLKYQ